MIDQTALFQLVASGVCTVHEETSFRWIALYNFTIGAWNKLYPAVDLISAGGWIFLLKILQITFDILRKNLVQLRQSASNSNAFNKHRSRH
jgi:hypothetical protein